MDLRARLYYMDLYGRSPRRPAGARHQAKVVDVDEARLADEIRALITKVEDDLLARRNRSLREDARCVLLINVQHMIAQPILETGRLSESELMILLEDDIRTILEVSRESTATPPARGAEIGDAVAKGAVAGGAAAGRAAVESPAESASAGGAAVEGAA